jgi:hypothetical protein
MKRIHFCAMAQTAGGFQFTDGFHSVPENIDWTGPAMYAELKHQVGKQMNTPVPGAKVIVLSLTVVGEAS